MSASLVPPPLAAGDVVMTQDLFEKVSERRPLSGRLEEMREKKDAVAEQGHQLEGYSAGAREKHFSFLNRQRQTKKKKVLVRIRRKTKEAAGVWWRSRITRITTCTRRCMTMQDSVVNRSWE